MALKVKAQEKLQKIGTHAGKYRNGDCYGTRSHIMHGHVATKEPPRRWLFLLLCHVVHIAGDEGEIVIVVAGWNTSLLPAPHTATGIVCSLPDPTFCRVRLFF